MNLQSLLSSAPPPHAPYESNAVLPPLAPTPPLHTHLHPNAMDHPPNPSFPFSDHEKRYVIAEAIKSSSIPLPALMHLLEEWNFKPNWDEICLPPGRTPISCRQVFEDLRARTQNVSTPGPSYKRRSIGDLSDPALESARKRFQLGPDPAPRPLQPKPAPNAPPGQSTPITTTQAPKRRGRPTNAQLQARAFEAVQRGEMLPSGTAGNILGSPSYGDVPGAGSFAIGPMSMPGTFSTPSPQTGDDKRRRRGRPQGSTAKSKVSLTPEQHLSISEPLSAPATAPPLTSPAPEEKREESETNPVPPQPEPPQQPPVSVSEPVPAPISQLPPGTGDSSAPKSPSGPNILNPA
ncbi:hypothetical protein F5884DRAFT_183394 [Xylogone sp. PMI_703]|nr:hypothetical protein F5884DRAFT_183394 [Xylogone sp. PMI_703]